MGENEVPSPAEIGLEPAVTPPITVELAPKLQRLVDRANAWADQAGGWGLNGVLGRVLGKGRTLEESRTIAKLIGGTELLIDAPDDPDIYTVATTTLAHLAGHGAIQSGRADLNKNKPTSPPTDQ